MTMKKILFAMAMTTGMMLASCGGQKDGKEAAADVQRDDKQEAVESPKAENAAAEDLGYNPELLKEGAAAPTFTLKDENGKDLSLSDLKGKHVVIDFWGTWCPWCVKGIPEMKASYEKYSDKLEIVSVDCGDKEGDWKDAIKEHEMTWKNVFDGNNEVVEKYEIQGFPTKIVLDPDGKILKVFVGESEDFYKYLDETLKI